MGKQKISILSDLAIILAVSLALLSGLVFSGSWPQSHDGIRYLGHLDQFKDAFDSGILYPRWFPNYYGGYGYPIFIFYQPGYFFFSLPFAYVFPDILTASYASIVAMFFIGGSGVYFLIRRITAVRVISLFCSMMFLLTPYIYVNIYVRGDLSELLAMFLTPWVLYFLMSLKNRIVESASIVPFTLILSLVLAAMVYCHPFTSMFFCPLFCVIMLAMGLEMERKTAARFLVAGGGSIILAVIFSSPYWLTAFQMKDYVEYHSALGGFFSAEKHVVYFQQLFSRAWGFEGSAPGTSDGMSFQLGLPHFILALLGFWLNRRNKFYLSVFILYVLCILMMTPLASVLWENIPLLNIVQFPWRLLSVIALLQIVCVSGIWRLGGALKSNIRFRSALAVFLLFTIIWNSNEFHFVKFGFDLRERIIRHREVRLENLLVYESFNEFLPKTATSHPPAEPRGNGPILLVSDLACKVAVDTGSNSHHMRYSISSAKPQIVMISQLYFPGWKIILDDKAIDDSALLGNISRDGRIQVEIPAGENQYLEAYYEGPPGWHTRNILIGIVFLIILVAIMFEHRKYSNPPVQQ